MEDRETRLARLKEMRTARLPFEPAETVPATDLQVGDFLERLHGSSKFRGLTVGSLVTAIEGDYLVFAAEPNGRLRITADRVVTRRRPADG